MSERPDAPWHCGQCVGGWDCTECHRLFSEPGDPALTSEPGGGAGPDETPSAAQMVGDRSREHLKTPESQGDKP